MNNLNEIPFPPVFLGSLNGKTTRLIDARLLHKKLGVQTKYEDWIKRRIDEYGFIAGQDYLANSQKRELGAGRGRTDCHLTLDTAKEIAMVEKNEAGRFCIV